MILLIRRLATALRNICGLLQSIQHQQLVEADGECDANQNEDSAQIAEVIVMMDGKVGVTERKPATEQARKACTQRLHA